MIRSASIIAALALAAGCSTPADKAPAPVAESTEAMAWTSNDNPAGFSDNLEYTLAELPREGEARRIPWAGNYWPVWQDGYNYRWQGEGTQTLMEKYGEAFDVSGLPKKASQMFGVEGQESRKACTEDAQCDSKIGEKCAKREGAEEGRCIPTWFGVCHAWAPAAVLFDEPQRPVERNGVTFQVNDLKALATLLAEDVEVKFVSLRCDDDEQAEKITYDAHGRPAEDGSCIDTNPATWHVLLSNYLGIKGQSFVEDRTYDDEVWNQPLRGYRVLEMDEIDAAEANRQVGVAPEGVAEVTDQGRLDKSEWHHFAPIDLAKGQAIEVTMTGAEGDIDLYVRKGAQPTSRTYDCRPYAEGSNETCRVETDLPAQVFVSLYGYARGDYDVRIVGGGAMPAEYRFNPNATRFFSVVTEVDFIAESPANMDGALGGVIDRYTHTDRYTYVLELDDNGRLIGGEWTGDSKRNHPDFVWLPERLGEQSPIMGGLIDRGDVLSMLAESVAGVRQANVEQRQEEAGQLADGEWVHFGPFEVAPGGNLNAALQGTGDLDLYVRRDARPTAEDYDCRPYTEASAEDCAIEGQGPVYVSVNAYAGGEYTLNITWTGIAAPVAFAGLDEQDEVAQGQWLRYELPVEAGQRLVIRTTAANDVDLYIRMDSAPQADGYDKRAYTASGNERIELTTVRSGVLHIAVHGYAASDVHLVVEEQD